MNIGTHWPEYTGKKYGNKLKLICLIFFGMVICSQSFAVEWWGADEKITIGKCQISVTLIGIGGCSTRPDKKAPMKTVVPVGKIKVTEEMAGNSLYVRCKDDLSCIKSTTYDLDTGAILCESNLKADFIGHDKNKFKELKAKVKDQLNKCADFPQEENANANPNSKTSDSSGFSINSDNYSNIEKRRSVTGHCANGKPFLAIKIDSTGIWTVFANRDISELGLSMDDSIKKACRT